MKDSFSEKSELVQKIEPKIDQAAKKLVSTRLRHFCDFQIPKKPSLLHFTGSSAIYENKEQMGTF